jgi:zinc protease
MKNYFFILIVFAVCIAVNSLHSQEKKSINYNDLLRPLPRDSSITFGRFQNGLTYYIRANHKPEHRAELRLVVRVGSLMEDDDQRGLAHVVEHMAFDGTEHFKKHELINYLESIGMRFAADLNASTGFDETIYMLQIPTDADSIIQKAFQMLEDWSHAISFNDDEIERERKVIIEEWRLGRGADARIRDKQLPLLFRNSRYADRIPIGDVHTLETFKHDVLKRFYRDWYRPDLMAVIAVGDFDPKKIQQLVEHHFSHLTNPRMERRRVFYPVPDHADTVFAIASDSEATSSGFSIYYKHELLPQGRFGDYRRQIVEALYSGLLNQRLSEIAQKPDPPFLYAYSSNGPLVRTKEAYTLSAAVKENGIVQGMATILTEALRARQYDFTSTELARQKEAFLNSMENAFKERDKTESDSYAEEYVRNLLTDEPIPGIAFEYELYKAYIPEIRLEEIKQIANQFITNKNIVIAVDQPEKSGIIPPTASELGAVLDSINHIKIQTYLDTVSDKPLITRSTVPGKVIYQDEHPELGVTEMTLSNGVKVILKPTDFKNDQIEFVSFSSGGTSLLADSDYIPGITASSIIDQGGLGNFDLISLGKKLSGKLASATPYIGEFDEGISGSSSVKDAEIMFQLVYLYFTAPRKDSAAYLSYLSKMETMLMNRGSDPEAVFEDTLQVTMSQYHPRRLPWTLETLRKMSLDRSYEIYKQRFADASDFTFVFVGNFTFDFLKVFIEQYLGSLPAINRNDHWRDNGVRPPKGVIEKILKRGVDPKSEVRLIFTGPFQWSIMDRFDLNALVNVLRIKLREILREDKGGTYGVAVDAEPDLKPIPEYSLSISFGCNPNRADELTKTVFLQIDSIKNSLIDRSYIEKVMESERRERETSLKQNEFWLSSLQFYSQYNEDPDQILTFEDRLRKLTPEMVQDAANKYLDVKNYVKAVLLPQESKK